MASVALAQSAPAAAAPAAAAPAQLGEIVVTAQRRSENLQHAAISVSAVGGEQMQRANITTPSQLTNLVPAFRSNNVAGPYANFTLRGIGTFSTTIFGEGAVVVNLEGVPLALLTSAHGMFYDLERVEVLKGPQGTLYGRNATGGVINVIAKKPGDTYGGNLGIAIGNYNARIITGGVDIPISDDLKTRTAFQVSRHDGYMQDGTDDEDNIAGRFTARYRPTQDLTMTFVGDYSRDAGKGNGATLLYSGATGQSGFILDPRAGVYNQNPLIQQQFLAAGMAARNPENAFQHNHYWGATGTLDYHMPVGDLTVIAAHREVQNFYFSDVPAFYYGEDSRGFQDSVEARLSSNQQDRLRWLVGTFYLRNVAHSQALTEQNTSLSTSDINNKGETYAAFGQSTYSVTDRFRVTGGIRYTIDEKSTVSPRYTQNNFPFATYDFNTFPAKNLGTQVLFLDQSKTWHAVTWKAGLEYDLAPDSLLYANIDRGFKAGVFFFASPTVFAANPEHVTAYTIGSKNRFFDRRLQLNVEGFLLQYDDQQLNHQSFVPGVGNTTVTENIGKSKIYGFEVDGRYLVTDNTLLNLTVQYEHARYLKFQYISPTNTSTSQTCPVTPATGGFTVDCSGRPALYTPEWIIQGGIEQTVPLDNGGSLKLVAQSRFESARWLQLSYIPEARAGAYTRTDLSVAYQPPASSWTLTGYVQNLENRDVKSLITPGRTYSTVTGGLITAALQPPRTYGVRLDLSF